MRSCGIEGRLTPRKPSHPAMMLQSMRVAALAAVVLYIIASGAPDFDLGKGFAANGYGEHSPGKYGLVSAFVAEFVLTAMFLFVIMGATHGKAPVGFAPIAIGLGLTLINWLASRSRTAQSIQRAARVRLSSLVGGRWRNSGCSGLLRSWAGRWAGFCIAG